MKWLKSTNDKEYVACGKIIPAVTKAPIGVPESDMKKLMDMAVIKSLIATGGIIVLDKYTDTKVSGDAAIQKLQVLSTENAKLADRIRELEADAEAPSKKELKAAEQRASDAEQRASDAETKLAELQTKYAELEKEANEKLAALSAAE